MARAKAHRGRVAVEIRSGQRGGEGKSAIAPRAKARADDDGPDRENEKEREALVNATRLNTDVEGKMSEDARTQTHGDPFYFYPR